MTTTPAAMMNLTGVYVEKERGGQNPHWVAVYVGTTENGKVCRHIRLNLTPGTACREQAEQAAMTQGATWND